MPGTVDEYRRAYAGGLTVVEVALGVARRHAAHGDPAMFIGGLDPDLLQRAEALDRLSPDERAERALFGVPFAAKDNIDVAGVATTAGCPAFAYRPEVTAPAVQHLLDAGALYVGKTNLDQFATGLVGTRTPYGAARNVLDPALVPGGSSSGSAVAVAAGIVALALGTDTAGSGRVPAALNQIVGLKPTRGLVPASGVVPACASLDCVSVFANNVTDAFAAFACMNRLDPGDPWHRGDRAQLPSVRVDRVRVGVAGDDVVAGLDPGVAQAYHAILSELGQLGATLIPLDLGPFLAAGQLLYGDALVAERHAAVGQFVDDHPDDVVAVTGQIIGAAARWSAAEYHRAETRVRALAHEVGALWSVIDVLALPTVPGVPTVAEVLADPLGPNAELGRFTTFTNVLDLAALTIPSASARPGGGLTFHGPANADGRLASLALALEGARRMPGAGSAASGGSGPTAASTPAPPDGVTEVVVVGAHLEGQALNHQLTDLGAALVAATTTAPCYRLWALPDGRRPALEQVRPAAAGDDAEPDGTEPEGAAIEVEVWAVPTAGLGQLLVQVSAPLALGSVRLVDGTNRIGFVCETGGLDGAIDITVHGGWRRWLAVRS